MTETELPSMESRQLHSSQKEAMKKMMEFSGESNELDIDEWLFDLTNLYTVMKLNDQTRILETMGKLTGPALRWYQENLRSFSNWEETETALRNRFKEFTSTSQLMQDFFNTHQMENESVISFYENVIRRYRKAQKYVTERQVITVLQTGVKNILKEELIRHEDEIKKPEQWLQFAREEEYIQKRIQQQCQNTLSEATKPPFFDSILPTATIQSKPQPNRNHGQPFETQRRFCQPRQSEPQPIMNHQLTKHRDDQRDFRHRQENQQLKPQWNNACLICNRLNHPTNQCFYKKDNGCYKCGQSTHRVRDCPSQRFFE
jgi:hypothetical protein